MTMTTNDKKMLEREALRSVIQQWNANRLDLFELSEPDENLQFHGVMRFYFQDAGQKVATKCIRVASDATVADVIETLVEKFRPDMRMLTLPNYALYEVHSNHEERKLNPDEKPLLVQLNWHIDDREGRFLLKNIDQKTNTLDSNDTIFKRKLSKREKKEQKKKDKLAKLNSNSNDSENHVAERLYTELPETSFTRSISNPEAVMRRRRQQKLEKKLQQFRSRDGGPDTDGYVSGGTLKIYGESLCRDVPYKTLLLSIRDCAQAVVREMLAKYGMEKADPLHYCLVQVNADATEYILDDDECPLSILMNHPTSRGSIMFHVRRRPADSQPRRRKKKPLGVSNGSTNVTNDREGPTLVEITHSGDGGRRVKLGSEPIEVGSANTNTLQLFGPSIQPRHCLISLLEGVCTVTPLHADALTFVNGHHIQQPTILHNGSVVMFGRVASYRFIDSPSDGRYNLALSQSQLDSACLYESRSPVSSTWPEDERPLSPVHSVAQAQTQNIKQKYVDLNEISSSNSRNLDATSKQSFNVHTNSSSNHNNIHHHHLNAGILHQDIDQSSQHNEDGKSVQGHEDKRRAPDSNHLDVPYDIDGNTENETKSISSIKSTGSNQDIRSNKMQQSSEQGQEPILPAVLEFPETHQDTFLRNIISELDVNTPNFKLAPVYTLYLCARYRASTHYRPDLQPTERAHKLTVFLHHVANLIHNVVQDQYTDPKVLSFWMANSSEFLYFLKSDRHISAFSVQAQEVLAESVQTAFRNLVTCFHAELSQTLSQFMSENIEHEAAAGLVLQVLGSAMALFRRCRVNAALTIQLFSQLFHYINVLCFNKIVKTTYMCTAEWGKVLSERLQLLELWAERQGLELAADCHLAKINQCAQFLQAPKGTVADVQQLACSCFKLNSLQMAALLSQETIPRNLVDTAVRMAESVADELARADGREIRLEESPELPLALILPDDGFSCDVVRGIPAGLVDFLTPLQGSGMCRLAAQPTSIGLWTVYMHHYNGRSPSAMSSKTAQPEVQVIKLHKHSNGMGLSIVAAKGAGQERLGIYIKSVVPGGAADLDGRLQAGDQLLRVDGQSLIGITQERAADYLVRTGPVVTLEVAKQGAIYHGLATLLQQPSPVIQREGIREDIKARYKCRSDESLTRSGLFRNDYLSNSSNYLNRFNEPLIGAYSSVPERRNSAEMMFGRKNSLSHESILNTQYPKIPVIDPRYRDSRPIVHTSSSSFEINWDMNPTILVEEYKDNPEPERIATSVEQEEPDEDEEQEAEEEEEDEKSNEEDENIGYCGDDSDDIPFIDDENSCLPQCEIYIPPKMKEITRCGIMMDKNKKNNLGYRKTVSFDTSKEPLTCVSAMIPKSKTYEYVIDLEFNKPDTTTSNSTDKLSNPHDRISVYFNNNDDIDYRNSNNSHNNQNTSNKIDINDITLDLTGLSSDSTTCSSSFGEKFYSNNSISVNVSNNNQNIIHNNSNNNGSDFPDTKTTKDQFNNSKNSNNNDNSKGDIKHNETPNKIVYAKQKSYDDLLAESSVRKFNSGTRRMSERDLSRQSNADSIKPPIPTPSQNLLNAKSTPALHHVGNIAMSGNKSRSIHNLVGNNTMSSNANTIDQGFYQNLSIYRAQNQSQPNLGDRGQLSMQSNLNINAATTSNANLMQTSNRPASAYFNNTNSNTLPSQSTMSYMMQPNNNASSSQNPIMPQSGGGNMPGNPMLARQKNNNFSGSQNMRMNQMMAPSMPNIAHSSGYAANISASQSMQNVNMISNYHPGPSNQHLYTTTPNDLQQQQQQQQQQHQQQQQQHQQQQQQQRLLRGQAKLAEMGEELKRRHQRQPPDMLSNDLSQIITPSGSGMSPQLLSPTGNQHNQPKQQMMLPGQQNYPNQGISNGPMSPIKQLPPTAPKPSRFIQDNGESLQQIPLQQQQQIQPPLPPTQTHPLFKNTNQQQQNNGNLNYVASVADPPKVAYYPISSSTISSSKNFVGSTNPWEREEREKEQEIRREHIRHWRDQQIFELSSHQHRTPQQDEQLKTLVLERDFERRALETEEQEEDMDLSFSKDSVQELIRLQPANQLPTPITSMKQVDIKDGPSENYIPSQQSNTLPTIQPKSILKHNNNRMDNPASSNPQASPSKQAKNATFADDKNLPDLPPPSTSIMNQMMKDIYNMNLNNSNNVNNSNISKELELGSMPPAMQSIDENFPTLRANMMYDAQNNNSVPPPPPERNSSYVIMSQQQQKIRTSTLPNMANKQSAINPPAQSTDTQNNNYQMSNNTKKIPTISNNLNNNNHNSNNSNLINNNNVGGGGGPQNLPPQIQIPSSQIQYNMQQPLTPPSQFNRDNKRVSFHDEENNLMMSSMQQQMIMSGMTDQQQLEIIREDPNRFINETQALLDSPMTPDSESWNSPIQMTPGVIGAQEVYRDPRTRRLAEKQQAQQQKTDGQVPEKLSFKEKMKMFALESGEDQTPKDKVKISRAQRDIDAVH